LSLRFAGGDMRSRSISIIAPIIFFASMTVLGQTTSPSTPEQWEYKITDCLTEPELNKLGLQGWELVSVRGNCQSLYFKRPKGVPPPLPSAPPSPTAPACNMTLAQAPVISGFRLGMSIDEVLEQFPRSKDQPNVKEALAKADVEYGWINISFSRRDYPDSKSFVNNISQYRFGLLDGRVTTFSTSYRFDTPENPNWNPDTWIDKISQPPLNLPTREKWSGNDGYNKRVDCQGFSANIFVSSNSTSISIHAPNISEIINSRRNAEYEKRRREFKP
jgi:hypothetical protein